jgi:beta-glucosidase
LEFKSLKFPKEFIFGASTAAYQIEGGAYEDGKGLSIWDTFCKQPGRILNGDTGDEACDFYHRYKDDIKIMKEMRLDSFRFSISWPRVFPEGTGKVNQKGLDFYNSLVDELRAASIEPYLTLNHWDMPQSLQDQGGWLNKDTAKHFADYSRFMCKNLSDRVKFWTTHNEPHCVASAGYVAGIFAPGHKDIKEGLQVTHNLNLAHGLAVQAMRQSGSAENKYGIVLAVFPYYPATASIHDHRAAQRWDGYFSRCFLDPIFKGSYPEDMVEYFGDKFPEVTDRELSIISEPIDMLGINCYFRRIIENDPKNAFIGGREFKPRDAAYTQMDWPIYPECLFEVLSMLDKDYNIPELYIIENGAAFHDEVSPDGHVHDARRTRYLHAHIEQAKRAVEQGINLKGYFVWSFLDNFEWALGYSRRFGIVYVDYPTQTRVVKDSGKWYSELLRYNQSLRD